MWCQTGKVTLVPIEEEAVRATVEAPKRLPRTPQEGGLVTVRLKKKLEVVNGRWAVAHRPILQLPKRSDKVSITAAKRTGLPLKL